MNVDVEVKNLGRLKEGTIKIRPITVIAGPNGTGKSFFTKSLYSIFNVINKNVYQQALTRQVGLFLYYLEQFEKSLSQKGKDDEESITIFRERALQISNQLANNMDVVTDDYLFLVGLMEQEIGLLIFDFDEYKNELSGKKRKFRSVSSFFPVMRRILVFVQKAVSESSRYYSVFVSGFVEDELQENFQIQKVSDLISFGEESASIKIDDLFDVTITESGVKNNIEITHEFFEEIAQLSSVVFFESPAYWKVREALNLAKDRAGFRGLSRLKDQEILSGVPKYFYDVDDAVNAKTKLKKNSISENSSEDNQRNDLTKVFESALSVDKALGGEFLFDGDVITFKEHSTGREIAKNLMSFGMTNLGMISALIKNNVIQEGSFLFIDEPETNLHPEWQVILSDLLVELARNNVYVVIATHSTDMLKAMEVSIKDIDIDDFLSVNYFDNDGTIFEYDSESPVVQVQDTIAELNSAYEALYYKGVQRL